MKEPTVDKRQDRKTILVRQREYAIAVRDTETIREIITNNVWPCFVVVGVNEDLGIAFLAHIDWISRKNAISDLLQALSDFAPVSANGTGTFHLSTVTGNSSWLRPVGIMLGIICIISSALSWRWSQWHFDTCWYGILISGAILGVTHTKATVMSKLKELPAFGEVKPMQKSGCPLPYTGAIVTIGPSTIGVKAIDMHLRRDSESIETFKLCKGNADQFGPIPA